MVNNVSGEDPSNEVVAPVPQPKVTDIMEDDEDEDVESLVKRIPADTRTLEECIIGSQGCLLLLMLKQHLKDTYGITDRSVFVMNSELYPVRSCHPCEAFINFILCFVCSRISGYSPSDATKAYERPANRRNSPPFEPKCTIANLSEPPSGSTPEGRRHLIEQYIHVRTKFCCNDSLS